MSKAMFQAGGLADPPKGGEAYGIHSIDINYNFSVSNYHTKITAPRQGLRLFSKIITFLVG